MNIFTILTIILESLNIGDIATTEYGINKGLVDERNPLLKNDRVRRVFYIPKLLFPLLFNFAANYNNNITRLLILITEASLTGIMTGVVSNNIYQILKGIKNEKRK